MPSSDHFLAPHGTENDNQQTYQHLQTFALRIATDCRHFQYFQQFTAAVPVTRTHDSRFVTHVLAMARLLAVVEERLLLVLWQPLLFRQRLTTLQCVCVCVCVCELGCLSSMLVVGVWVGSWTLVSACVLEMACRYLTLFSLGAV